MRKRSAVDSLEPVFRKTVLPDGIRVLTEKHAINRAVACGIWIDKGTRDESPHEAGLAHFVEHMVFKRTRRRTAYQISRDMEAVGADLNAFTSREYTCFVSQSLKEDLALSLDVLSDLVRRPSFESSDIRKEKQVVLQEIHMAEDQLEDFVFDKFFQMVYADSPLGRPILGTVSSIKGMKRQTILDFHARLYTNRNLIVTVAGNVEHDEALRLVLKHLKPFPSRAARTVSAVDSERSCPEITVFREVIRRPSEQVHILVGLPASDFRDRLRFAGLVVNTLLGGGMTSRLYQNIREDRGLAYTIYSQLTTFTDSGLNLIYAGTEPKKVPDVLDQTLKELKRLRKGGVKRKDLEFFKKQVKGQILLGADDIENRMNSIGINEMVFGRYRSVDEITREVEKVSLDHVHEYIETYVDLERTSILLMGPLPEAPVRKWLHQL